MNLKDKLKTLPSKPGCYLMKDEKGTVIYVGKAISLKNRVNSYFIGAHDYKTTKLVSNIRDFDYIITKSEKEALILEYNLIKEYDPKYNIVFKDDKSYPYILLSDSNEPYISVVRLKKNSKYKGKLFGPYPDVTAARNSVDIINKLFLTRKCSSLRKEPCLYYHLNDCPGYCINDIDEKTNNEVKENIARILSGDNSIIINDLKDKMQKAVDVLDYEKAASYRDLINDINSTLLKQYVQKNNNESFDVINYETRDGFISITSLFITKGKLLNSIKYTDYLVGDVENYVSSYIYQFYTINQKPKTLYVPKELLVYLDGLDFPVKSTTRGHKYQLLKQAKENSSETLKQKKQIAINKDSYYSDLEKEFERLFHKPIERIELFDNSHTAGKDTVAAMVVYENFKPNKSEYRLFKLEEGADDLSSMREVLYRRYFRVLKDDLKRPDLIIVDGAKTQIMAAKEILSSLNMDIPFVGLGKDEHHNTSYLMNSDYEIISINKDSNLFYFLANTQDEVHRFAINYHRKLRSKNTYRSLLDDVEGLGDKSRTKLLRKFKTISNIKNASLEELSEVLNKNVALRLYNKLKENENA